MNIDVVSFQRLAYRIFDELGKTNMAVLEETGKNLVLRKVAEERMDDLCVMQGNMKKMGYISEVKSLISELTQYNIDPDTLETFIEEQNMPPALLLQNASLPPFSLGWLQSSYSWQTAPAYHDRNKYPLPGQWLLSHIYLIQFPSGGTARYSESV